MQKKKGKNKQKHKVFSNNRAYEINTTHVQKLKHKKPRVSFHEKNFFSKNTRVLEFCFALQSQ